MRKKRKNKRVRPRGKLGPRSGRSRSKNYDAPRRLGEVCTTMLLNKNGGRCAAAPRSLRPSLAVTRLLHGRFLSIFLLLLLHPAAHVVVHAVSLVRRTTAASSTHESSKNVEPPASSTTAAPTLALEEEEDYIEDDFHPSRRGHTRKTWDAGTLPSPTTGSETRCSGWMHDKTFSCQGTSWSRVWKTRTRWR
ncbi:unnamed protein product [Amoebophrya sp. A120]|nr:unnamed protein product [Amoebophrya sp. A120]|eukprot:GSA120T00013459001.1